MRKKILLFLGGLFLVFSFSFSARAADLSFPSPSGHVNDFANILSAETKSKLEQKLSDFEKSTSHEIAVVTVNDLQDTTIEDFAVKLFEEWRIGKKGLDNGLLLIIAPNERKLRIEVGYGLEGIMPDITAKHVLDDVITPEFKNSNYDLGVVNGVDVITKIVSGEKVDFQRDKKIDLATWFWVAFFIFYMGYALLASLGKSKRWWPGGVIFGAGGLIYVLIAGLALLSAVFWIAGMMVVGFVLDFLFSKYGWGKDFGKGGRGGGPWFFGGGGSKGGGGFGGFGGGMSGGGGASGSW